MSRRRRFAVLGLIVLLVLPALVLTGQSLRRALRAMPEQTQLDSAAPVSLLQLAEEEIHAVPNHDVIEVAVELPGAERWVVTHWPPQPVHLEREGRPPSAIAQS